MELPRLAAKQKRYLDVLRYTQSETVDPVTKPALLRTLDKYKKALGECWKNPESHNALDPQLATLEREIDALFNEARLRSTAP